MHMTIHTATIYTGSTAFYDILYPKRKMSESCDVANATLSFVTELYEDCAYKECTYTCKVD